MYRLRQIRLDQCTQIYTGLGHDVWTKLDQTIPKSLDQYWTRPQCPNQTRPDQTKVYRVNKIIPTYADQIRTDQTKVSRPKGTMCASTPD